MPEEDLQAKAAFKILVKGQRSKTSIGTTNLHKSLQFVDTAPCRGTCVNIVFSFSRRIHGKLQQHKLNIIKTWFELTHVSSMIEAVDSHKSSLKNDLDNKLKSS